MIKIRFAIIFIIVFLLCVGCGVYSDDQIKLYLNGERTYVFDVEFREGYVVLYLDAILNILGMERTRNGYKFNNKTFIVDADAHRLYWLDEDGYSEYLHKDQLDDINKWNNENTLFSSENIDNDNTYVLWEIINTDGKLRLDHKTLIDILENVGIDLQVNIDYQNKKVYLFYPVGQEHKTNY